MIRIVIADDHSVVRAGLRSLLEAEPGIEVVGEAEDGREALARVKRLHPDVLLLDIGMPELNGLEVLSRLLRRHPAVRPLILSMHGSPQYVARALAEGAAGYMLKEDAAPELVEAVRAVAAGRRYLSPALRGGFVDDYLVDRTAPRDPFEVLTPRQREVLQLVAEGDSTAEIAEKLFISVKTVETHRADLMKRLDIHDVASLVRYAIRRGITELDS